MQAKIKKFIRNVPEEDLKSFLDGYELNLPQDFKWQRDNKKYHSYLFDSIWSINNEERKIRLFEIIERIHEMIDELGQAALHSQPAIVSNDNFLDLKSDHARCLWAIQNHPLEFQKAEFCASSDYKRKSREWSSFVAPQGREIHASKENIENFKQLALEQFNISKKIKVDLFDRVKTDHHDKEIVVFQLVAYHDGLHRSIQIFEQEEVVTKFISSVNEFSISYEPHSGIIEVISDSKENRGKLAKAFANAFLKAENDIGEIVIKKYDLSKLRTLQDFMKDTDASDLIDEVKVTMLKLGTASGKSSTTLEAPFTSQLNVYEFAAKSFANNNPLQNPAFEIRRAKLSIRFKATDKKPRGELLHVTITNPNGCDLKDRSEKQKMIGNKYLERWGLMERI